MSARRLGIFAILLLVTAPVRAQSTVAELNEAGWKALRNGYTDRAASIFAEALTQRPNDPVLLLGAGAAADGQGKHREAMARLQRALELNPRLTPASQLLGQIAFNEGDVDLAIRTYEKALKYAPSEARMAAQLDAWRRDADVHRSFDERRYDQFRVMFEGRAEESLAAEATEIFHRAFRRICGTLGEYPPGTIVAVLYTEQQFRDITRAPQWSGGQYDGRIRIPVAGASQNPALFERVLTHELAHAVIAGIAPRGVPAWLNEGLAQYFEGADPSAAQKRLRYAVRTIPLSSLERGFGRFGAADAQVAYDESLLAVNVMLDRPGFSWVRLLHELADGRTYGEAMKSSSFSYPDLEASIAR